MSKIIYVVCVGLVVVLVILGLFGLRRAFRSSRPKSGYRFSEKRCDNKKIEQIRRFISSAFCSRRKGAPID